MDGKGDFTQLLDQWRRGDASALERLTPLVYDELRRLAYGYLRHQGNDHTLQATALVHEAYLKLAGGKPELESRGHFLAVAAKAMRHILVDHARSHRRAKRGGDADEIPIEELPGGELAASARSLDVLALDAALDALRARSPRAADIVEMRYFGGLTAEEIAAATGVSTATVSRDLRVGQAWLRNKMVGAEPKN